MKRYSYLYSIGRDLRVRVRVPPAAEYEYENDGHQREVSKMERFFKLWIRGCNGMESLMKTRRRSYIVHRGAAVIELAVVLPVFGLLVLGTIETCNMIFLQQSLKIAAYEAARVSLIPAADTYDVETTAADILSSRHVNNGSTVVTPANFQSTPYGSFIRIEVSAPCSDNSVFPLKFYGSKILTGTVEMMKE